MSDQQSSRLLSFNFAAILAFVLSLVGIDAIPDTKRSPEAQVVSAPVAQTNTQADPQNQKRQEFATELPTFPNVRTEIAGRWADPFKGRKRELTPINSAVASNQSNDNPYQQFQEYLKGLLCGTNFTILPIQLDSGNLPSQVETRVNTRHAVEYALATAGYEMDYEDRMSYVSPCWKVWFGGAFREYRGELPIKLYSRRTAKKTAQTEGCVQSNLSSEYLLVCWIDNQLLGTKRIQTLTTMLENFVSPQVLQRSRVRFIGPSYSSEVNEVQLETEVWKQEDRPTGVWCSSELTRLCNDFRAISPWATSPPAQTIPLGDTATDSTQTLTCTMATDKRLAQALVTELTIRRRQYGHVLIVREAGSGSPDSLSQEIAQNLQAILPPQREPGPATLTYLKNIAFGENGKNISRDNPALDDYFQRQLANVTQNRGFSGDDVSAVFVIGNDTQDKLTILKNLKPLFSNATFFTHDLHYNFYNPDNLPTTRGLVVGSRGTLSVDDEHSQINATGIPPGIVFRDCYQKATYQAVLSLTAQNSTISDPLGTITLYEIGFNGPYLLSTPFAWTRPARVFGIAAGLLLTLAVIAFVRNEGGRFHLLPKLSNYLTYGISEFRSFLLFLSPVDAKSQTALAKTTKKQNTNDTVALHLFLSIFDLRAELGIAGVCTLSVWRCYLHNSIHGAISTLIGFTFIPLTLVMVTRSLITLWPRNTPSAPGRAPNVAISPIAEHNLFKLWLHAFILICVYYTCVDAQTGIPLIEEPFTLTSGISSWPVLAGLFTVIGFLAFWLRNTWRRSRTTLEILLTASSTPRSSSADKTSMSTLFSHLQEVASAECSPAFSGDQPLPDSCVAVEDRLQVAVRIAMLGLLILFASSQYHSPHNWLVNWGLLPLPPTRGSVLLASITLLSTLGLLLTLNACLSGLIQVRLLLSYISQKQSECIKLPQRLSDTETLPRDVQECHKLCLFIQDSTSETIRHSLRNPALLLLAYSCCRLPVLESWAASTNTILLIAGIPTIIAVTLALQLRFSSNKVRSLIIAWLESKEMPDWKSAPTPSDSENDTARQRTSAAIKTCRAQILALNQGAFSNIWQDPILGTVFFLATALGSSQGFNPITFLLNFIPG